MADDPTATAQNGDQDRITTTAAPLWFEYDEAGTLLAVWVPGGERQCSLCGHPDAGPGPCLCGSDEVPDA